MNKVMLGLTALMMLGFVAFMAPNVFALNRGKVLRNIAIWLGIFAALGLFYKYYGPGGSGISVSSTPAQEEAPPPVDKTNTGNQGFTPPKD